MDKVNVGIMGTGKIAGVMAETLRKMNGVKCYAAASRTKERARRFGSMYDVEQCYGSYEEMAQDEKVDLIYIATPHSEHYENAKLCIENGKAVLCEKAFMANAVQAREVLELAEQRGVLVAEAMWIRYMPMYRTIKDALDSGILGDIRMVTANLAYNIDTKERMLNPALAGGTLLDLSVYPINFASMILGTEVEKVTSACVYTDTGVDRQESITLTYQNGSMAVLNGSMSAVSDRRGGIYGTKGYAIVENINNFESMSVYNASHEKIAFYERSEQISGYEYEVEACIKALREGWKQCPEMPHAEILRIMELMDGLRREWDITYPFEQEKA